MVKGFKIFLMFVFAVSVISLGFAGSVSAAEKAQTKCPVMGGDIDKSKYTDYKGTRVYFCCPGCIDEFKKNPEKYMKKLKDDMPEHKHTH